MCLLFLSRFSNKSFQPTSTQLSFQVSRIDQTFKPELAPFGFGGASHASGASSSIDNSGALVPVLASFPTGSSTLTMLPLDEMNTPISALKEKGRLLCLKRLANHHAQKALAASSLLPLLSLRGSTVCLCCQCCCLSRKVCLCWRYSSSYSCAKGT